MNLADLEERWFACLKLRVSWIWIIKRFSTLRFVAARIYGYSGRNGRPIGA
jgi:hypothetical protein